MPTEQHTSNHAALLESETLCCRQDAKSKPMKVQRHM